MGNNVCGDAFIDCRKTPGIFQYRLAYSFLAGDILTVVINDEGDIQWAWGQRDFSADYRPDREAALTLIKNLTAWRKACPEFLQRGRAQHPLPFDCSETQIFTNRGPVAEPDVLSAAYSYGGKEVDFLVNWNDSERTVSGPELAGKEYSLSPGGQMMECRDGSIAIPPLSVAAVYH